MVVQILSQGTGFVVTDEGGHPILIEFSVPVGGPVASVSSKLVFSLSYREWRHTTMDMFISSCLLTV